jgi:hypothetical protein
MLIRVWASDLWLHQLARLSYLRAAALSTFFGPSSPSAVDDHWVRRDHYSTA